MLSSPAVSYACRVVFSFADPFSPSSPGPLVVPRHRAGLDDYPRSPLPSEQEFHLDLFCWIFTAARVMSRLERTLLARAHKEGAVAKKIAAIQKTMGGLTYDNFAGRLQSRLEFLHWSHPHQVRAVHTLQQKGAERA